MGSSYVYLLVDPKTSTPFYAGKGSGKRAWTHESRVRCGRATGNPFKDAVISKILAEDRVPSVVVFADGLTDSQALELERRVVEHYGMRATGGSLTNLTPGGIDSSNTGRTRFTKGFTPWNKGRVGFKHSEATKAKMSKSRMGHTHNLGRKQPREEIAKRAASMIGRQVSEETRAKIHETKKATWERKKAQNDR